MHPKYIKIFTLLVFLVSFLPFQIVLADTGPKPTMDFQFTQAFSGDLVSITGGTLFECEQADCSDAEPLIEGGPQRLNCEANSCHALAYGFAPYHRLELQFSDGKTRQSNIFETAGFKSTYNVTIQQDDLLVESQFDPMGVFSPFTYYIFYCVSCLLLLVLIAIITIILVVRRDAKKH